MKGKYYGRAASGLKKHKLLLSNFSWLSLVEIVTMLTPLLTYPYVVGVLGSELYGYVISAQVMVSYAQLIIDFGSNSVCAKHVSINRADNNSLSEIVCSVFWVRLILWFVCLFAYMSIVQLIPIYRDWKLLFFLTYFMALNEVLYPRYFFQGIENMKFISIVSISTKLFFVLLVFVVVRRAEDYLYIPILYSTGFSLGGFVALWVIFKKMKIKFTFPKWKQMKVYIIDALPIFSTDLICTIKDKLNYQLLGIYVGMSEVVIYDLGFKLNNLISKPTNILSTVLFPKFAKSRDLAKLKKAIAINFLCCFLMFILLNAFMPWVVEFFLHRNDIDMWPIRIISFFPVILSISYMIAQNYFIAFGHNIYMLYSILITTLSYVTILLLMIFTNNVSSIYSFIFLSMTCYLIELLYRIFIIVSKESTFFRLKK